MFGKSLSIGKTFSTSHSVKKKRKTKENGFLKEKDNGINNNSEACASLEEEDFPSGNNYYDEEEGGGNKGVTFHNVLQVLDESNTSIKILSIFGV